MPMYEYECAACGHRFERIRKFSDPPIEECPSCGKPEVQKLLSSPAIQFKGTGWYITDYAKKGAVGTESAKESKESSKESNSKESKESTKESKESKESTKSTESKESKSGTPASGTTSTPKASGE